MSEPTIQEYAVEYIDPDGKTQLHTTGIGPVGRALARTAVEQGVPFWGTSHRMCVRDLSLWRTA